VDRVLTHHSISTLILLATILAIAVIYETLLGHARRLIVLTVGTKMDTRLNLHVFNRLLRLPLDYFERHPAGETMHKIGHVYKIREFLTGKLLSTFLDLITLLVLLPFLFYLNVLLAGMVLTCSALIMLVIFASLRPLRAVFAEVASAETDRASILGETIFGIRTVKSLALETERKSLWDEKVARAGKSRMKFGRLASWPQTIVTPIERFMSVGVVLIGAYMALSDTTGYAAGALFAFMMLSMRVAQPLVGLAKLFEDYEEVGAAIGEAASVLNRPLEDAGSQGLRPRIAGAISFDDVSFTYPGARTPALDRVSFQVPAGSMLGIVGRSGSGKSTIARLLQGINREFTGFVKIDGNDLRAINLRHLRRSFGVVLQDNYLFRGSVRDNIIASRPGLTMEDAVRAARLAGAEEFIERMPDGYETIIEEGSPNLSGGQRQRLAIARALITDPPVLILDEPTSALDPESEALVNANILRIGRNRTTVIVSHRLSSLTKCNQILVMDKGSVVDVASHPVLLERCVLYRQLWIQQTGHLDPQQGIRHVARAPAVA
jgi:subfamily B ATP-binding cassette protein HlyB/CyaB